MFTQPVLFLNQCFEIRCGSLKYECF